MVKRSGSRLFLALSLISSASGFPTFNHSLPDGKLRRNLARTDARTPLPHSADSERAILGAIILDNGLAIRPSTSQDGRLLPARAQLRLPRMISMSERGAEINPILLGEELRREGVARTGRRHRLHQRTDYGLPHFLNSRTTPKSFTISDAAPTRARRQQGDERGSRRGGRAEIILDHAEQMIFALAPTNARVRASRTSSRSPTRCSKRFKR